MVGSCCSVAHREIKGCQERLEHQEREGPENLEPRWLSIHNHPCFYLFFRFPIHEVTQIDDSVLRGSQDQQDRAGCQVCQGRTERPDRRCRTDRPLCVCVLAPGWSNEMCMCLQGEPGAMGVRGPEGAPGIGTQGEKVRETASFVEWRCGH